jgi:hypothetical protein
VNRIKKGGSRMNYIPKVSTGHYPDDAGWASRPDGENILVLCIPQFNYLITVQVEKYSYAWLYDQELEAYIFCFNINNKIEEAVIFKKDHAGVLLQEKFAANPFTIIITHKDFETLHEKDLVFTLEGIEMKRSEIAGW